MAVDLMAGGDKVPTTEPLLEHAELLERLTRQYGDRVGQATVEFAVRAASAQLAGARIDTFVPILIERHARERIRTVITTSSAEHPLAS